MSIEGGDGNDKKDDDEDDKSEGILTPVANLYGKTKSSRSIRATEPCPLCHGDLPLDPRREPCEICGGDRYTNLPAKLQAWKVRYELLKGRTDT